MGIWLIALTCKAAYYGIAVHIPRQAYSCRLCTLQGLPRLVAKEACIDFAAAPCTMEWKAWPPFSELLLPPHHHCLLRSSVASESVVLSIQLGGQSRSFHACAGQGKRRRTDWQQRRWTMQELLRALVARATETLCSAPEQMLVVHSSLWCPAPEMSSLHSNRQHQHNFTSIFQHINTTYTTQNNCNKLCNTLCTLFTELYNILPHINTD